MEAKHIQDIMEAYASLYAQPEQEVLSEEVEHLDEITASMGRRAKKYKEDKEQAAHMERVRQHQHNMENNPEYRERHERLRQTHSRRNNGGEGGEDQKESFDLFDYLLEYLVAEGYADTNKAALAIMANMSEEWKQSIVEGGINFSVPSRIDDFNNRRDELKNRYKQDVGPRIPGPGGGGQYGEPSAPKATGVRLARGTSSSNRGTETKNNA